MNPEEIEALKNVSEKKYSCDCTNNKSKPVAFVCVACGKCYHSTCVRKIKHAFHLIGNLICCCEKEKEYNDQDFILLKTELSKERDKASCYSKQCKSLLQEINEIYAKK